MESHTCRVVGVTLGAAALCYFLHRLGIFEKAYGLFKSAFRAVMPADADPFELIESDPIAWAKKASQALYVTVLLKGSTTVVAHGDSVITLPPATPMLATAGSGNVLAGIIGALFATNYIEILNDEDVIAEIAATGALIHQKAAELASEGAPISASQIIDFIQPAIRSILSK